MKLYNVIRVVKKACGIGYRYIRSTQRKRLANIERMQKKLPLYPSKEMVFQQSCVFVLSTGRCGTKLLTEILLENEGVFVVHDPRPELNYISSLLYENTYSSEAIEAAILASRYEDFFLESWLRGQAYVETNNRITPFAETLARLFPNSKFIHLTRHPGAFTRSGLIRGYYKDGFNQPQRLDNVRNLNISRAKKIGLEWNIINQNIENFKSGIDSERVLTIKSEEMFSDLAVHKAIFSFIGLEFPSDSKSESAYLKRLEQPVNTEKRVGALRYDQWSDADKESLKDVTGLGFEYGYYK